MPKSTAKIKLSGLRGQPSFETAASRGSTSALSANSLGSKALQSPSPAGRGPLLPGGPILWLLGGLAIGLAIWFGGRAHLRSVLTERLRSAQSEQVAIESIDALLRLDSNATVEVARGLGHPEFMVANAAFRALGGQLDAWGQLSPAKRLLLQQQVVLQLTSLPNDLAHDQRVLVSGLASRIYADALSNREPGAMSLLQACRSIIALAGSDEINHTARLPQPEATDQTVTSDSSVPPPLPPLSTPSIMPMPGSESSLGSLNEGLRLSDSGSATNGTPAHLTSAPVRSSLSDLDGEFAAEPIVGNSPPKLALDRSSRLRTTTVTAPLPTPQFTQTSDLPTESTAQATELQAQIIDGMDQLPIDELVRLLPSLQPRLAQSAALALRKRGMSERNLTLAIELATGSAERRSNILSELVTRDDLDPRPWLLWMAADGQDSVRQHAVGLLHPLADHDVRRQLRLLLNKERNDSVTHTIRQVLAQ